MTKEQLNRWNRAIEDISERNMKGLEKELADAYKGALDELKGVLKQAVNDYDGLSFSKRMETDRAAAIAVQIQNKLNDANKRADPAIRNYKAKEIEMGYYGGWFVAEQTHQISAGLPLLPENYIETLVDNPVDGLRLSDRLYKNTEKVAAGASQQLMRGIVRGKGYDWVAGRMTEATEANYRQALRIARTEGGQVQSAAKQTYYEEAKKKGIQMKKRWMSTLDKKTRHTHQALDGQLREIDEDFTAPSGATGKGPRLFGVAKEDINCRCTTVQELEGYPTEMRRDNEGGGLIQYQTYEAWAKEKGYIKPEQQLKAADAKKPPSKKPPRKKKPEPRYEQLDLFADLRTAEFWEIQRYTNTTAFIEKLDDRQREHLNYYKGAGYEKINTLLRTPDIYKKELKEWQLPQIEDIIAGLNETVTKNEIKENMKTYRIVEPFEELEKIKPGEQFVEKGFMSTTPLADRSSFFDVIGHHAMIIEIEIPKGHKGLWLDRYSRGNEAELLLPPGTRMEYIGEGEEIKKKNHYIKAKKFRALLPEE